MGRDRISSFRQIRVIVSPARDAWYVAVLTRTALRGEQVDRMIFRTLMPIPGPSATAADVVRLASEALTRAADRL